MTIDDTRDIAIQILDKLVESGLVNDCTDTNIQDEFEVQDLVQDVLNKYFNISDSNT